MNYLQTIQKPALMRSEKRMPQPSTERVKGETCNTVLAERWSDSLQPHKGFQGED